MIGSKGSEKNAPTQYVLPGLVCFTDSRDQSVLISPDAVLSAIDGGVRDDDRHPLTVAWLRGHRRPVTLLGSVMDFMASLRLASDLPHHPQA